MAEQIDWAQIRTDLETLQTSLQAQNPAQPVTPAQLLPVVGDLITWVIHETEETEVV